jgi:hypothetical protein
MTEVKFENLPPEVQTRIKNAVEYQAPPDEQYFYRDDSSEVRVWFYKADDGTKYTKLGVYFVDTLNDTYYFNDHIPASECVEWLLHTFGPF